MDIYKVAFSLKPGVSDMDFVDALDAWLGHLRERGMIHGYRLMRRKLGLAPAAWGEFVLDIEVRDLAQLDAAFARVAARDEPEEPVHHAVTSRIAGVEFGLYRDFPDTQRVRGQERF